MPTTTQYETRRLAGALGIEVLGLDLEHITDDEFAFVKDLFDQYLVVFFPDQELSLDGHIAFGRRFGEIEVHPYMDKPDATRPEVSSLTSSAERRAAADSWHTDLTFQAKPALASIIHAIEMPDAGGDTMFMNLFRVYEELSPPIQDMLNGLTAIHTAANPYNRPEERAEHPAVRVDPITGKRAFYLNGQYVSHIPQLRRGESDALLAYLYQFSQQPQFQCRYHWRVGDVGIWNNRFTQHYALNDYDERRVIHRVTVIGDEPVGDPPRWPVYEPERPTVAEKFAMGTFAQRDFERDKRAREAEIK